MWAKVNLFKCGCFQHPFTLEKPVFSVTHAKVYKKKLILKEITLFNQCLTLKLSIVEIGQDLCCQMSDVDRWMKGGTERQTRTSNCVRCWLAGTH